MNYKKIYKNLMQRAKTSNREKFKGEYFEKHHIVPVFMFKNKNGRNGPPGHLPGNPDDVENIVLLTAREHFIAHLLMAKMFNGTKFQIAAEKSLVFFYTTISQHPRHGSFSASRKFEWAKKYAISGLSASMRGGMSVKDAITGEKMGRVPVDHPKVVSGEWVHCSKWRKLSQEETEMRREMSLGMNNANARPDLTVAVILDIAVRFFSEYAGSRVYAYQLTEMCETNGFSIRVIYNRFSKKQVASSFFEQLNMKLLELDMNPVIYDRNHRPSKKEKRKLK